MSQSSAPAVTIVLDPQDPIAAAEPVQWAVAELRAALTEKGMSSQTSSQAPTSSGEPAATIVVAGGQSAIARRAGVSVPDVPEALVLQPAQLEGADVTLAVGSDVRGTAYAALELADRVRSAMDATTALQALRDVTPVAQQPANEIRSIMRLFTSDVEDLGWFHDRAFWGEYLSTMARDRFNRFHLALGIGFDFATHMLDSYFYFPYPFLLDVPGYAVRATGISDEERRRNLEQLRFVARETKRRGLHFQLGVWANVYVFEESPDVNHRIEGLTPENHARYCRDALRLLLEQIPEIDGITLRIHGESGIPEGSYDYWRTLLSGIAECGRRIELDMHSKGIDQQMIDLGLATGQRLLVSPKFWAEHMGLPYHQADIRALEQPGAATGQHARLMNLSIGSRRFTRYGYADLLPEDRQHGILWRIWPGTQRVLLWGDAVTGRAYSRAFGFGGSNGVDVMEPLSFSGRRGSGLPDGRDPYKDPSLRPEGPHAEWKKYRITYRLWGRLLYDPDADPETWRRDLRAEFGPATEDMEAALASASRILPLVTSAHGVSAANNSYWPEIYTNMPIVASADGETRAHPYSDTTRPRRFGTASAFDPETFSSVEEYVGEALAGTPSGRCSPLDVARWLDRLADEATNRLDQATAQVPDRQAPEFRRWEIDIRVEAGLGRFFAAKLRAATGYTVYTRTGDVTALEAGLAYYRQARDAWSSVVDLTRDVYKEDLTFGPQRHLRGHWADRLAAIDEDIQDMAGVLDQVGRQPRQPDGEGSSVTLATLLEQRPSEVPIQHAAPAAFAPGAPLTVEMSLPAQSGETVTVRLHYRHVTQAERFATTEMRASGGRLQAEIPGEYTQSPYALQYFFEVRQGDRAARWPGLGDDLAGQPYFVVHSDAR